MTTESLPLLITDEERSLFGSAINDWDKGTSRSEIQSLNTGFLKYRSKVPRNPKKAAREFKRSLQLVALRHKDLVSRSADLQSKLDELNRR